jgi:hypothetical protein
MRYILCLLMLLSLLVALPAHANSGGEDFNKLEFIKNKVDQQWDSYEETRIYRRLMGLGLAAFSGVLGSYNLRDSLSSDIEHTSHQPVASGLFLTASLMGAMTPVLYFQSEPSITNYRWQMGLGGAASLLAGAGLMARGTEPGSSCKYVANCPWRNDNEQDPFYGGALIAGGAWFIVQAIWDPHHYWSLMEMRSTLAKYESLSKVEQEALAAKGMQYLKNNDVGVDGRYYFGSLLLAGGVAGAIGTQLSSYSDADKTAGTVAYSAFGLWGVYHLYRAITLEPDSVIDSSPVNVGVGQSPYTGDAMLMVAGRF